MMDEYTFLKPSIYISLLILAIRVHVCWPTLHMLILTLQMTNYYLFKFAFIKLYLKIPGAYTVNTNSPQIR